MIILPLKRRQRCHHLRRLLTYGDDLAEEADEGLELLRVRHGNDCKDRSVICHGPAASASVLGIRGRVAWLRGRRAGLPRNGPPSPRIKFIFSRVQTAPCPRVFGGATNTSC